MPPPADVIVISPTVGGVIGGTETLAAPGPPRVITYSLTSSKTEGSAKFALSSLGILLEKFEVLVDRRSRFPLLDQTSYSQIL